jgi:hypothetical protein
MPRKDARSAVKTGHLSPTSADDLPQEVGAQARRAVKRLRKNESTYTHSSTRRVDWATAEFLKIHALQRRVTVSCLVNDVLNMWLHLATDQRQAIFRETLPSGTRVPDVPERWVGYLATLGFAPAIQDDPTRTQATPREVTPGEKPAAAAASAAPRDYPPEEPTTVPTAQDAPEGGPQGGGSYREHLPTAQEIAAYHNTPPIARVTPHTGTPPMPTTPPAPPKPQDPLP